MLKLHRVTKIFNPGGPDERVALRQVSLEVPQGQVVTIIGSNGAGKSTLLNVIAGVYSIEEGAIFLEGQDISSWPEYRRAAFIGRVFQDPTRGTAASMTVEENLALAMRRGKRRALRWGITPEERRYFKEQLAQLGLGLEDRIRDKVGLLSGGQRQALAVLMATLTKPKLLLLDEHTAALDPRTAKVVMELTQRVISQHQLTALMVTHNMDQALRYGHRTLMMHEGRIILDISDPLRSQLKVSHLLEMFEQASRNSLEDRILLTSPG